MEISVVYLNHEEKVSSISVAEFVLWTSQVRFITIYFGKVIKIMNFLHECALKHYQFTGYFEEVEAENENLFCVNMSRWLKSWKLFEEIYSTVFVCFT